MTHRLFVVAALVVTATAGGAVLHADDRDLPVKEGRPVVAVVNDDSIFLDELAMQLTPPVDRDRLLKGLGTPGEIGILERLIDTRLIAREASTMGIGDLAEIRKQVDVYGRQALRDVLLESIVKDISPDEKAVEAAYKDLVREWKTSSLLFTDEPSATAAQEAIASGAEYAVVAAQAVAEKKATASDDPAFHSKGDYLPEIAAALATLGVGQVSPVVHIKNGFVVLTVLDIRYPDNKDARGEARRTVLAAEKQKAVKAYEEKLRAARVVSHKNLLASLDYTKASVDTFLKDTRVLADIRGAKPVTVADLTDYMRMQFFHSGNDAGQAKRLNARKAASLDTVIGRRLLNSEATRRGIDKTNEYLDDVNAFEESLVFGMFVEKVIAPESKVTDEEIKSYYDQHLKEYSTPEMLRLRSLVFTTRPAAEDAIAKLRNGADFAWLSSTAEGQVGKQVEGVLTFDGQSVTSDSLPEGMQKALAEAKSGDTRLYASPEGLFYLLSVQQVTAQAARPLEEVRSEVIKSRYGEKLMKGVTEYARKLRAASRVETYLKKAE